MYTYGGSQIPNKMPTLKESNRSAHGPRFLSPNLSQKVYLDGAKTHLSNPESPKSASYASDYTLPSSPTSAAIYDTNSPQARTRNDTYNLSKPNKHLSLTTNFYSLPRSLTDATTHSSLVHPLVSNINSPAHSMGEHGTYTRTSSNDIEEDFAAGVRFVESYHGPHRILTRESSDLKQELYACYKQATCGPCHIDSRPSNANLIDVMKWQKWLNLGQMTRHEAMKKYTYILDTFVDDWRRQSKKKNNLFEQSSIVTEIQPQSAEALQDIFYRVTRETEKWQEVESRLAAIIHDNRLRVNQVLDELIEAQTQLSEVTRKLEEDAQKHKEQMEVTIMTQRDLSSRISNTKMFAIEAHILRVFRVVKALCPRNVLSYVFLTIFLLQIRRIGHEKKFAMLVKFLRGIFAV